MKRLHKLKGMYALLIAVAAVIGITIYGSCSADEDYDGYYYPDNELSTRADGIMDRGNETPEVIYQYPTRKQILASTVVRAAMDRAWEMTLDSASENGCYEFGFFIYYRHTDHTFYVDSVFAQGQLTYAEVGSNACIDLGHHPIDNIEVCAFFHTHVPVVYSPSPVAVRPTGPSPADEDAEAAYELPGFVYDYTESFIDKNTPLYDSAEPIGFGRRRRATFHSQN